LETYQREEGLKREETLTKTRVRAKKQDRINLPVVEMIQEMIPVAA